MRRRRSEWVRPNQRHSGLDARARAKGFTPRPPAFRDSRSRKALQVPVESAGLLQRREMPGLRNQGEPRARDRLGHHLRIAGRREAIFGADHDQRRKAPERGQELAGVWAIAHRGECAQYARRLERRPSSIGLPHAAHRKPWTREAGEASARRSAVPHRRADPPWPLRVPSVPRRCRPRRGYRPEPGRGPADGAAGGTRRRYSRPSTSRRGRRRPLRGRRAGPRGHRCRWPCCSRGPGRRIARARAGRG